MTEPILVPSAGEPALTKQEKDYINEHTNYAMGDTLSSILFPLIDEVLKKRARATITDAEWQRARTISSLGPSGEAFDYAFREDIQRVLDEREGAK